jgi:hypothetical protein
MKTITEVDEAEIPFPWTVNYYIAEVTVSAIYVLFLILAKSYDLMLKYST